MDDSQTYTHSPPLLPTVPAASASAWAPHSSSPEQTGSFSPKPAPPAGPISRDAHPHPNLSPPPSQGRRGSQKSPLTLPSSSSLISSKSSPSCHLLHNSQLISKDRAHLASPLTTTAQQRLFHFESCSPRNCRVRFPKCKSDPIYPLFKKKKRFMITSENKVPVPWFVGHDVAPIFPGSALATPCSDWTFSCSVPYIPLSVAPFLPGRPRSSPTSHRTFCDPLLPTTPHAPIIPECLSPVILPP